MDFEALAKHIEKVQHVLQGQAAHAINLAVTSRNWLTGYYIVEYEQHGEDRAKYGERVLQKLEKRVNIKGMTARRFREYRQLYLVYPELAYPIHKYLISNDEIRRTLSAELGLTQKGRTLSAELASYGNTDIILSRDSDLKTEANRLFTKVPASQLLKISTIEDSLKRFFYEVETIRGCWSYRELDRQISSLYYERSGLSGNKEALAALVNKSAQTLTPKDTITSPMALEFLGLNSNAAITENDLEQAILDNLQQFLLELGEGWCFEGRQKRILIDEDYFKIDLVFYSRILKCHLLIELKIDRFHHEYASQLNMYLNYYKNEVMQPDDNPPIGLLLCTDHGETIVKYATAGMDPNLFVRKYKLQLPSEEEIKEYLIKNL